MTEPPQLLSEEADLAEIEAMFPHAEYQPDVEVMPLCAFCDGAVDDHKANCVVPHVHALIQTVRALRAELGQRERTMKFWEESYLAEHETWGNCQWKAENAALREQLADTERERNAYRGQLVSLNSQMAQAEKERSELQARLEGEQALDLITNRQLKPEIHDALEQVRKQP